MDWQTVIAVIIVATAAGSLARRWWRMAAGQSRGGCGDCPSNPRGLRHKSLPLVQLTPPRKR